MSRSTKDDEERSPRRRAALLAALGLLVALVAAHACVERSVDILGPASASAAMTGGGGFDKRALLANLGDGVFLATYKEFAAAAAELEEATVALAASPGDAERQAAQDAWREAMRVWQRAEMMQLGPAADMGSSPGGQDLRDAIYSWTLVNPCAVDQKLVDQIYLDPAALGQQLLNVRGLDAMEYLLFHTTDDNRCPPQNDINTGPWDAIVGELDQRRADYARSAAQLVRSTAEQLVEAWSPSGGDFSGELSAPGNVYPSEQEALNAVADAMFYVDRETKDLKIAMPSGLSMCSTTTCPQDLELPFSGFSKQAIRSNLEAFQLIYLGGPPSETDAIGFDDWLVAVNQGPLADDMSQAIIGALEALDAIEEEQLGEALEQDLDSVHQLHAAVQQITNLLKADFITVLNLDISMSGPTDND